MSPLTNTGAERAIRRIVVFFVVDPDHRIISTREVPPQQQHAVHVPRAPGTPRERSSGTKGTTGTMSRAKAMDLRLKLMKERKFQKQDWNVRTIELCEH